MVTLDEIVALLRDPSSLEGGLARHGVAALREELVREQVAEYVAWLRPDAAWLADIRRRAVLDAEIRRRELTTITGALCEAGVTPVVFKGGAWAPTVYPEAWCRPQLDLDLLVSPGARARAFEVLERIGYRRAGRIPGQIVNGQEVFEREVVAGTVSSVDLHWQVSNRVRLTRLLPADEVIARSTPAPFAAGARQMAPADALLVACLHPFAHHITSAPLKWALDVSLLARHCDAASADRFLARAADGGVTALVRRALLEARALTPEAARVAWVDRAIDRFAAAPPDPWEAVHREQLQDAWDDLRALPTLAARARLLREIVLPPAWFLRARYGRHGRLWLPVLYGHRLVSGGARWVTAWARGRCGQSS